MWDVPVEIVSESEHSELWCLGFVFLEGLLWWEPQPEELLCLWEHSQHFWRFLQSLLAHLWIKGEKFCSQDTWGGLSVFNSLYFSFVNGLEQRKMDWWKEKNTSGPWAGHLHLPFPTKPLPLDLFSSFRAHGVSPPLVAKEKIVVWVFYNLPFPLSLSSIVSREGIKMTNPACFTLFIEQRCCLC